MARNREVMKQQSDIKDHYCEQCNGEMFQVERQGNVKKHLNYGNGFRKRIFECEDCGWKETVFAGGAKDVSSPSRINKEANEALDIEKKLRKPSDERGSFLSPVHPDDQDSLE